MELLQAAEPLLAPVFELAGTPVSRAELLGTVLSLAMVLLNMRVHPAAWPLAIASSLLYALLFASSKLYGEAALQLFFVGMASWGWWCWLRGTGQDGTPLRVHRLSTAQRWRIAAATLLAWPALAGLLIGITDSTTPWLDALPTVGSIAGTLLLGRKALENWPVWVMVNLVSVALFASKALWLTTALYALFALMAVTGWRAWLQLERRDALA
ncbi:MAG: nicotinamide mononucleotide transporter [Burkholderiales bacterium]|nr:nicotinamide mononucleotide transporter [Burkholderiales bacterium]